MSMEPGNTVILRSGSPVMTIEELGDHDDARCTWFYGNELRREWFSLAALRIAPPTPAPQQRQAAPQQATAPVRRAEG